MAPPAESWSWFACLAAGVSSLKCLFINAYRSTDFEVHRNWLAITHSSPVSRWYHENTSEWTSDYPPSFAWFELGSSQAARLFDEDMSRVENSNHASPATVSFQRSSVVFTDSLYIYAVRECCRCVQVKKGPQDVSKRPSFVSAVSSSWNFGLLIVDHLHFQYNGFSFGFSSSSVARHSQSRHSQGASSFAVSLNSKHIFSYVAPAFGIFSSRSFCFTQDRPDGSVRWSSFSPSRFSASGCIVSSVFASSFGPFVAMGQLPQLSARLFPFKRGLCHAYWAPNVWALYSAADKASAALGVRSKSSEEAELPRASMTGGLVQEFQHAVLPSISPSVTLVCTSSSISPASASIWRRPRGGRGFSRCSSLCASASFMFGWHVHEKAVLMAVSPLSISAVESREDAGIFSVSTTTGHYSSFPLIFTAAESPIKVCSMSIFTIFSFSALRELHRAQGSSSRPSEVVYSLGLVAVAISCESVFPLSPWRHKSPFLPSSVTSVYCAVGISYSFSRSYLTSSRSDGKPKQS